VVIASIERERRSENASERNQSENRASTSAASRVSAAGHSSDFHAGQVAVRFLSLRIRPRGTPALEGWAWPSAFVPGHGDDQKTVQEQILAARGACVMPGYGAERAEQMAKRGGKRLKTMTIHMPSHEDPSAGHVVEHAHADPAHSKQRFQFAPNEKEALAAHLSKHLGIKLPGKAAGAGDSAEPSVSKSDFE
jgi:hypothetical protein